MEYTLDLRNLPKKEIHELDENFQGTAPDGREISFTSYYMQMNGKPFFGVAGEFHYSRCSAERWEPEIRKMKAGGINIISTYVFWIHHEEEEGIFDFSGRRDLRRFVELCAKCGMYVILRIGPFDHGEVRNGGLPDWLYGKPFEMRKLSEGYLFYVRRLYRKIGEQVRGLMFRNGGPVIAAQIDNEYMHASAAWENTTGISDEWIFSGDEGDTYLLTLRELAKEAGIITPFYTCTGWGGAPVPDSMMPLWGGYSYRPWLFYSHRGEHPKTEEYIYQDFHTNGLTLNYDFHPGYAPEDRPYACCEMGGGMFCTYNYRFQLPYRAIDAMANIKLASGCNFLGYYMYQGGTNPRGKHGTFMNEAQAPKMSYDYQAPLGEFGQVRESFHRLRTLHYFLESFGAEFCQTQTVLPEGTLSMDPEDLDTLRFAARTDGHRGWLFLNNFQDHADCPAKCGENVRVLVDNCGRDGKFCGNDVRFEKTEMLRGIDARFEETGKLCGNDARFEEPGKLCGNDARFEEPGKLCGNDARFEKSENTSADLYEYIEFRDISLASGENCILPFHINIEGIDLIHATAQPVTVTERNGRKVYVFLKPEGMQTRFVWEAGTSIISGYSGEKNTADETTGNAGYSVAKNAADETMVDTGNSGEKNTASKTMVHVGSPNKTADIDTIINPTASIFICSDEPVELYTVKHGDRIADVLCLNREMTNRMYRLADDTLIFSDAVVTEEEGGLCVESRGAENGLCIEGRDAENGLCIESRKAENILWTFPEGRFAAKRCGTFNEHLHIKEHLLSTTSEIAEDFRPTAGMLRKQPSEYPFLDQWLLSVPEQHIRCNVTQTAAGKYQVELPDHFPEGLWDAVLQVRYVGDIGHAFIDGYMIHDNFCNGAVWELGLREYAEQLSTRPLTISITPLRKGAKVNVESAMAARHVEIAEQTAELQSVKVVPVYRIRV